MPDYQSTLQQSMPAPGAEPKLATPFNRFVAASIDDGLWFAFAGLVFSYIPESVYDNHLEVIGIVFVVLCSGWLNYFSIAESKWGYTVGKHVMGMRVAKADGSKAGFGPCSVRNLLRPFDYLLIGPLMIATTKRHQRLGDKFGGTIVVDSRPEQPVAKPAAGVPEEDLPLTQREHRPL